MPRPRLGSSRKQSYGISLDAESALCLADIGNGSVSAGVNWLIDEVIRRDPRGVLTAVANAREAYRKQMQDALNAKIAAQEAAEQAKAKKKEARGPSTAARQFKKAVDEYMAMNEVRFAAGQPLYDMSHMAIRPELVAAVYAAARAKYGWEKGPRPEPAKGVLRGAVGESGGSQPVQTNDEPKVDRPDADISVLPEEKDARAPEITQQFDLSDHEIPGTVDSSSSATVAQDTIDAPGAFDTPGWAPAEVTDVGLSVPDIAQSVTDNAQPADDLQKSNTPEVQEPEF